MSPQPQAADSLIWISGATEGIGLGLSRTVPYDRARIVNLSRRRHPELESHYLDLADHRSLTAVAEHFLRELAAFRGQRAIFIQNAHLRGMTGFAAETGAEDVARDIAANVAAPLLLGDAFLRAVVESGYRGEAGLVMMSSAAARSPYEGQSIYCAGKAALEMWVRVVRRENERRGRSHIWVTAVRPGFVDTGLTRHVAAMADRDYPVASTLRAQLVAGGQAMDADSAARQIWAALPARQSLLLFGEQVQVEQPGGG
ncbi:3-oxoacyl-ACP reductase [Sphingobium jiangsuense]|uniref:NAD(P)-dependent dehydrogenase (Short-subunit alcohol dehydrogenase family) n=1 Tax=Sphingobium jiangsuense TaxID=870476 RepID=A0A7W6BFA5_9SPHN|nr:SDR family NAD(P)-dependent oxidoreductase [Sphingobium jiangsuense]MBB3925895.1 NAD(P)-dependent dehydrogenase (short-subunit alcohol dehydrogenase family) [Sphingobium jiangsuense]GLS98680.1 3-oxoacyl-ACP reductase [Sphingobium jiangsuense]